MLILTVCGHILMIRHHFNPSLSLYWHWVLGFDSMLLFKPSRCLFAFTATLWDRQGGYFTSILQMRTQAIRELSDSTKITQLGSNRAKIWTQLLWFQIYLIYLRAWEVLGKECACKVTHLANCSKKNLSGQGYQRLYLYVWRTIWLDSNVYLLKWASSLFDTELD